MQVVCLLQASGLNTDYNLGLVNLIRKEEGKDRAKEGW